MKLRNTVASAVALCSMGLVTGIAGIAPASAAPPGGRILALAANNTLITFNAAAPGTFNQTTPITGVLLGEKIVGIDQRPSTGDLFGVGVNGTAGHLYSINTLTGAATLVAEAAFSTTLPTGGTWAVDFNPVADRIRLVHSSGVSLRIDPTTGALAGTDTNVAPAVPAAVAYDRSTNPAPLATTLFAIDAASSKLAIIGGVDGVPSPNTGATTDRGPLGVTVDSGIVGFDIAANGDAIATLRVGGVYKLYSIDLTSGAATAVATVGNGNTDILDVTEIGKPAGPVFGLTANNVLVGFDARTPGTYTFLAPITGLAAGETIVGFDVRPATGQLFAVGVNGTTGTLYTLDPVTGAATKVGAAPFSTTLPAGGTWAVDFNPTVDRIRLVHAEDGANFRLNPLTGALAATDTAITGGKATAVAYDRSMATSAATTLFAIDDVAKTLDIIGGVDGNPSPNGGVATVRGPLGVVNDTDDIGFDITPFGDALATMSVAGVTGLYTIDLATGAASSIGNVGNGALDLIDIAAMPGLPAGAAQFTAVPPTRLLDTRTTGTKPGPNSTLDLQVTGVGGVPANATAIVLNVTGTEATADGFVTVFPAGETQPLASNNNLITGDTKANLVTTKIGKDGKVSIFTQGGLHLVADVFGYYAPATGTAGRFNPLPPARLIDTRTTTKVGTAGTVDVQVTGQGGVPATGVSAVIVDLTATDVTIPGYVTAYATGTPTPGTSNLNVIRPNGTVSNLAIVPVGTDGKITVFSQNGANIIVDVAGWFSDTTGKGGYKGLFVPVTPGRVLDTRSGNGAPAARLPIEGSIDVTIAGFGGIPATGASGAIINVTAVDATQPGFVTVYPTGQPRQVVASLNTDTVGQTVPNLVSTPIGSGGKITLFDHTGGHLVADVAGWFTS